MATQKTTADKRFDTEKMTRTARTTVESIMQAVRDVTEGLPSVIAEPAIIDAVARLSLWGKQLARQRDSNLDVDVLILQQQRKLEERYAER